MTIPRQSQNSSNSFFKKADLLLKIEGDSYVIRALDVALALESDDKKHRGKRCNMQVHASFRRGAKKGAILHVLFYSTDLVSLRASFNTNLRLVASALKTLQTVASLKKKEVPPTITDKSISPPFYRNTEKTESAKSAY